MGFLNAGMVRVGKLGLACMLASAIGVGFPAGAARAEPNGPASTGVCAVLKMLDARREAVAQLQLGFTHRVESDFLEAPATREGTLYYKPGKGMTLSYEKPDAYAVLIHNEAVILVQPDRAIERSDIAASPLFAGMTHILRHDFSALSRFFEVDATREENEIVLNLKPRRGDQIEGIRLGVSPDSGIIRSLVIRETSGDRQELVFEEPGEAKPDDRLFEPDYWRKKLKSETGKPEN